MLVNDSGLNEPAFVIALDFASFDNSCQTHALLHLTLLHFTLLAVTSHKPSLHLPLAFWNFRNIIWSGIGRGLATAGPWQRHTSTA